LCLYIGTISINLISEIQLFSLIFSSDSLCHHPFLLNIHRGYQWLSIISSVWFGNMIILHLLFNVVILIIIQKTLEILYVQIWAWFCLNFSCILKRVKSNWQDKCLIVHEVSILALHCHGQVCQLSLMKGIILVSFILTYHVACK
jgi:hypothetical protein